MRRAGFRTELWTRRLGAQRMQLLTDLVYVARCGRRIVVPAGFVSDGASTPRFLWPIYPPFAEVYEPAAWVHDFLYAQADQLDVTRAEADATLFEAAISCGYRASGARVLYMGVRVGGWRAWGRYRRRAVAAAA